MFVWVRVQLIMLTASACLHALCPQFTIAQRPRDSVERNTHCGSVGPLDRTPATSWGAAAQPRGETTKNNACIDKPLTKPTLKDGGGAVVARRRSEAMLNSQQGIFQPVDCAGGAGGG